MLETVLSREEFKEAPPVLVDVGASGDVFGPWRTIARFCHCVAFDPDARDLALLETRSSSFKSLRIVPRIVADQTLPQKAFYLAQAPHCSSCLEPNLSSLQDYTFARGFETAKTVDLPTITLGDALREAGLSRIDWLKVDSQGMDLRIFGSLSTHVADEIIVVDFEPGIIGAYLGEDKLHAVLAHMEPRSFWCSQFEVQGDFRINHELFQRSFDAKEQRLIRRTQKVAPGWAQLQYFNAFRLESRRSLRDCLLGWVFATIAGQHLFAFQLASAMEEQYSDSMARALALASRRAIRRTGFRILAKKAWNKIWDRSMGRSSNP